ncbi:MAG: phosphoglycerate dehydrogenase [Chloroflexi bacterium]|nr:phosphoglycerate dehydrogenase [Chloroflexota bacterium]
MDVASNKRVLVVSTSFGSTTPVPMQILERNGCEVVTKKGPHSEQEMIALIPEFAAVIVGIDPVTERVLCAGTDLKVAAKHGVGVDNIDVDACTRHKVLVTNVPGANSDAVAEFTICVLMAMVRRLVPAVNSLAEGRWAGSRFIGLELSGRVLGVIGLGAIGQRVAKRAQALGMRVIYTDVIRNPEFERSQGVLYVPREQLLCESDFVTLHVPAIPETRDLIDSKALHLMKPSAYLLNLSRGEALNDEALIQALREHRIAGAALDAFRQEPLPRDHPFFSLDNILLTPHMAGYSREANERTSISAAEDVARILRGDAPLHSLNMSTLAKKSEIGATGG